MARAGGVFGAAFHISASRVCGQIAGVSVGQSLHLPVWLRRSIQSFRGIPGDIPIETRTFGTIRLEDGQATLPVGPGLLRPAGLDMLATVGDREAMAAAAACLDALPKHLETVRRALMDRLDAEPDLYGTLFPHMAGTSAIGADALWTSLALQAVWTDKDATVMLDFGLDGAGSGATVLSAAFALDGTFTALKIAA